MRFNVEADEFAKTLGALQGIAERRTTMPILSHVRLVAAGDVLRATATDLEVTLTVSVGAEVAEEGALCLPARLLHEVVRDLSGAVSVETDGGWVRVVSGGFSSRIAGLPADDFPAVGEAEADLFPVPSSVLDGMLAKTVYAASPDELRRNLTGVYFERTKSGLACVATDGHRLSLVEEEVEVPWETNFLVPKKGALEMRKLIRESSSCRMGITKNELIVSVEGAELRVRLIDAAFPDYRQVLPKKSTCGFVADKNALSLALRRVARLASERSKSVKFALRGGALTLNATSPEFGEASERVELASCDEGIEIGFNSRYIMEALDALDSERVRFDFVDETSPAAIKPEDGGGGKFLAIVMPMRV
ncbi:MAG: DNA polymerase III subunit beta [Candidatus Methanosuratincola sp.]|jgi:DNA polymerase-3 subunit beta